MPIPPANTVWLVLQKSSAITYSKEGIRINAVCPGYVATPAVQPALEVPGMEEKLIGMHPIGRMGNEHEIADAVIWLSSDEASFVCGHALPVDGGLGYPVITESVISLRSPVPPGRVVGWSPG